MTPIFPNVDHGKDAGLVVLLPLQKLDTHDGGKMIKNKNLLLVGGILHMCTDSCLYLIFFLGNYLSSILFISEHYPDGKVPLCL